MACREEEGGREYDRVVSVIQLERGNNMRIIQYNAIQYNGESLLAGEGRRRSVILNCLLLLNSTATSSGACAEEEGGGGGGGGATTGGKLSITVGISPTTTTTSHSHLAQQKSKPSSIMSQSKRTNPEDSEDSEDREDVISERSLAGLAWTATGTISQAGPGQASATLRQTASSLQTS